jgi:hypothetical protein
MIEAFKKKGGGVNKKLQYFKYSVDESVFKVKEYTLTLVFVCFITVLHFLSFVFMPESQFIWIYTFAINLIVLFSYRKAIPVFIMVAFFLPYFYIPKYFFDGIPISFWNSYQEATLINLVSICSSIFLVSFFVGVGKINDRQLISKKIVGALRERNLFFISLLILVFILIFGIQGDTIFESGRYGTGEVHKSALYEYFIVFFLASIFLMNPKNNWHKFILSFLLLFYMFKALIYGGRIEVLQLGLVVMYLTLNFFYKKKLLLAVLICAIYIFLDIVAQIRANPFLFFNLSELSFLSSIFTEQTEIIASQYGDVYQSSLRIVGLLRDGFIDIQTSFLSFLTVVFGSFLPSKFTPDFYNLASYQRNIARSGGGGLISVFSFAWLSYFGPLVFGLFIGLIVRYFYKLDNPIINMYGLLVLITFPRWFAYYPVILFKMNFLGILIVMLIVFLKRNFNKRHRYLGKKVK